MRVLHLPVNSGSLASYTVRALRQQEVNAIGLVRTSTVGQSLDGLKFINLGSRLGSKYSVKLLSAGLPWLYHFIRLVHWADVVHWYSGAMALPFGLDLAIIKYLRKPGLVEWQGVEIRVPEVEFAENPYYTAAYHNGYEYQAYESLRSSRHLQRRFASAGFACAAPIGMVQYVQKDIFPAVYIVERRLILSDYQPSFPKVTVTRPVIVHSPSLPITKGTNAVLKAIEQLKTTYNFDFRLNKEMLPKKQFMQLMAQLDILLDQFVLGDYGIASLEAMAWGKPVVCYIKPSLAEQYPQELPIVNANQETLPDVLAELIKNPALRENLGRRGRAYIEKYHDARDIAHHLKEIYKELIQKRRDMR